MAKLNAAKRNALPESSFALPGRRYPINDRSHAQNAKARVSQHGTPAEKQAVNSKVKARYGFKKGGKVDKYGQPKSIPGPGGMRVNPAIIVGQ